LAAKANSPTAQSRIKRFNIQKGPALVNADTKVQFGRKGDRRIDDDWPISFAAKPSGCERQRHQ
jgi:hypothetical protein